MAMEFGKISKMSVGEVVTNTATEGGAVVAGLLGAGILGKQVEKNLGTAGSKAVTVDSSMTDKLIGYGMNNIPKLALWYLVRKEGGKMLGGYDKDIGKGALSAVVLDTVIRATNKGAPRPILDLYGYSFMSKDSVTPQMQQNMQKVLQENSSLRQQLNGALQRIASASPNVTVTPIRTAQPQTMYAPPPPDHDRAYGMMQTTPEAEERRKNFGAMTPPIEDERNRRFGAMNKAQLNFAGESDSMASAFGML